MSNKVAIFKSVQFGQVRTINEDGKILFCGKDVAQALGYVVPRKAIHDHCREKGVLKRNAPTNGGVQALLFIDEGNLYRLITHSKLAEAEKFESWVFDEVLPSIRQTGNYNVRESWRAQRAETARMRAETARINANIRQAKLLMKIAEKEGRKKIEDIKELSVQAFEVAVELMKIVNDAEGKKEQIRGLLGIREVSKSKEGGQV